MSIQECACEQKNRILASNNEIVCSVCGTTFGHDRESITELQEQSGTILHDSLYGGLGSLIKRQDFQGKAVHSANSRIFDTDKKNLKYDNFEQHIQEMQKDARTRLTYQHMKDFALICSIIRGKAVRLDSESNGRNSLLSKAVRKEIVKYTLMELDIPYSKTARKKLMKIQHDVKNISTWPIFQKEPYEKIYNKKKPGPKINSKRKPYSLKKRGKYCNLCRQNRRESMFAHWKKYHKHEFSHTIMYEHFEIESMRKIKDEIARCPKCDKDGSMYARKNGSWFFKHEDSTQHSISKKILTATRLYAKRRCNKENTVFETGVDA